MAAYGGPKNESSLRRRDSFRDPLLLKIDDDPRMRLLDRFAEVLEMAMPPVDGLRRFSRAGLAALFRLSPVLFSR
ncbi:MAG: hypothetical protein HYZ40_03145 [Rhodospirillales bacterium]|nr:hypothetical protein [Rhodospirillales bacterium]